MPQVVNIAAYQFVAIENLTALRERLRAQCKAWELKGTILLSPEGINLFLAGGQSEIDQLLAELRAVPGLENLTPKVSISDQQPFNRMLVRIKKEIIAFGVAGIEPGTRTSPKLAPAELKQWLDEGRPVTLLDTRNDYEVKFGTFKNAVTLGIDHFRHFPNAVAQLPAELKQTPIVMFCTGGIRCEKAGPFMEQAGFEQIFQLDGGILKYFEDVGGEHYDGECFVFDKRVGVEANLAESTSAQCFKCMAPLSAEDQVDPRYVPEQSCPHCYVTNEEQMARTISARHAAIAMATTPLPGSQPYDNYRPINISLAHDGMALFDVVCQVLPHLGVDYWRDRFNQQLMLDRYRQPVAAERRVRVGECYVHRMPATIEPDVNASIRILHEDDAIIVVDKPAPLPLHPSGRFNRNTLQAILNEVYKPYKPRPIHRLDANTTGLVLFAKTKHFASHLQQQFEKRTIDKLYLARIQGQPLIDRYECDARIGVEATDLGGRAVDDDGQTALTRLNVFQHFSDGTSLVVAHPITGRTNQIRVHLWHLGWPIVGEQTYLPGGQLGETQTHRVDDPPLQLHAYQVGFIHPITNKRVSFQSPSPSWA
jgi:UPF0176 protein